jgi:C-terminal processing protease CtpA/Prc
VIVLQRHYTSSTLGAARYLTKPLFVLISNDTFSAAEQFVYDIKALRRGELVGQITGGGANPGDLYRLNDHFSMFVPTETAYNPYTRTNWEGVGVAPDVDAPAKAALLAAYIRALKAVKDTLPDSVEVRQEALKDPETALRESLPLH